MAERAREVEERDDALADQLCTFCSELVGGCGCDAARLAEKDEEQNGNQP